MISLKPCALPGCPNLVERGYCKTHDEYNKPKRNNEAFKKLDSKKTKESIKFYVSPAWRKVSKHYRKLHPICERCERTRPLNPQASVLVHHIKPLEYVIRDKESPYNFRNLEALCLACHNRIHLKRKK